LFLIYCELIIILPWAEFNPGQYYRVELVRIDMVTKKCTFFYKYFKEQHSEKTSALFVTFAMFTYSTSKQDTIIVTVIFIEILRQPDPSKEEIAALYSDIVIATFFIKRYL
jgi:hypothetical protein